MTKEIEELKREKYSVLKTIEALEAKFKSGGIPKEFYLQKYRTLTRELHQIDTKLDELNGTGRY
ncbi:MAG: hypothetical protein ACW963_06025, partial [Candidatus Sifarchaeia archaeon]|jgi:hypothetical protein